MKVSAKRCAVYSVLALFLFLLGIFVVRRTWNDPDKAPHSKSRTLTPKPFHTPEEAAQALLAAAEADDTTTLITIFGTGGGQIISSGDAVQDKNHRAVFVEKAKQAIKLEKDSMNNDRRVLVIGFDEYPFSVPIVHKNGIWYFDTESGLSELLARRIGANELDAIQICSGYVEAQYEYAELDRNEAGLNQYAQKFISSPGKRDGLYWPANQGLDVSPISASIVKASSEGYAEGEKPSPYHGYDFKILKAQGANAPGGERDYVYKNLMIGGFGLVAWPADYGSSGIRTFIVNHAGVVYEKDLGPDTAKLVSSMNTFNPDNSWRPVR